jgi:hypothetical protein
LEAASKAAHDAVVRANKSEGELALMPPAPAQQVRGAFVAANAHQLTSKYTSGTRGLMETLFEVTKDGVLFVDEAYQLTNPQAGPSYAHESTW